MSHVEPVVEPSRTNRLRRAAASPIRGARRAASGIPSDVLDRIEGRVDRLVEQVIRRPSSVTTSAELARALDAARSTKGGAASMATLLASSRLARRSVGLGARRIPAIAAMTGTASALTAFASGFRELRVLASYLVHRARAARLEVHPARLRSVVLQVYLRPDEPPDAEDPPRLLVSRVASRWIRSAAAASLPLVPGGAGRPSVRRLASAADLVDVRVLQAQVDR